MARPKKVQAASRNDSSRRSSARLLSLPTPPASNIPSTTSRRSFGTVVKNSSDIDSDFDQPLTATTPGRSNGRTLKAVMIPVLQSGRATPSTHISDNSLSRDASYETPGTSAVHTPAESSLINGPTRGGGDKNKRTLADVMVQMTADERLAQSLQADEYGEVGPAPMKRRRLEIEDSEEELSDLSDHSEFSDDGDHKDLMVNTSTSLNKTIHKQQSRNSRKITGVVSATPVRSRPLKAKITRAARRSLVLSSTTPMLDDDMFSDSNIATTLPTSRRSRQSLPLSTTLPKLPELDLEDDSSFLSELSADMSTEDDEEAVDAGGARKISIQKRSTKTKGRSKDYLVGFEHRQGETRSEMERRKLEFTHPSIKTIWDELKAVPTLKTEKAAQPVYINRQLKSFQLEGLSWMIRQEKSQWKGGLLGDEMGMGKTIQAVSLIMSDYPAKDPTLVVVPPVALMQWSAEINQYTDGKLKVLIHHNTDPKVKKMTVKDLRKYDVIMISYAGLESMHRKETKGWKRDDGLVKENSRIHAIKYHRLILDEAHSIKSRTTGVAKACFALKSDYKWCLSGTPVQNRIGEFFSLLRFLEVKPFACYFCKVCPCREIHWSQNEEKRCTHCSHSGFNHVSIFNQELLNPITQNADPELRREALGKLRLITDRIMLRRMKRDQTASMELPPKEVIIHNEFFGEIERDFSSSIMSNTTRTFDTYVSRGVMLNNYANIFGLIMQMRQVANHPDLILKKHASGDQNVLVCCICDETAEEPIRSRCNHEFCRRCVKDYVRAFEGSGNTKADCPRCHIELSIDFDQPDIEQDEDTVKKTSIINRIKMEDWTSSTKIEMLIYDLYKLRSKKQTNKSIVFSQFTSMLQLVEWRLRRAGFSTVMLDGTMTPAQRQRSIEYFMNNVEVEVFLVSLKAGGVALNLTEASRVFIIDPWWNPAAEWQSADRCHRIGQKRPCVITRLCIEDSVESRMVMLQEKKANMINGTVNGDDVALEKLTPEDMQFLFRGS